MLNSLEQSACLSLNRYRWNRIEAENTHQLGLRLLTAAQLLYQRREYSLMRESISRAISLNNVSLIRLAAVWCFEGRFGRHLQARWFEILRYSSRLGDLKSKFTFLLPIDFIKLIKTSFKLFVRLIVYLMIKFNLKWT